LVTTSSWQPPRVYPVFRNLDRWWSGTGLKGMAKPPISDELWSVIEPLLPSEQAKPKGGRPVGAFRWNESTKPWLVTVHSPPEVRLPPDREALSVSSQPGPEYYRPEAVPGFSAAERASIF
jgi:hypothetical protein